MRAKAGSAQVKEEPHMQPFAMDLLDALGKAVGAKVIIADTHSTNPIGGGGSSGKIGCSLLSEDVRQWPYLVCCCHPRLLWVIGLMPGDSAHAEDVILSECGPAEVLLCLGTFLAVPQCQQWL